MHHFVTTVTAESGPPPSYSFLNDERANSSSVKAAGRPARIIKERVMTSTIITAVAASFLIAGTWAADLACYHPQSDSLDPLAPINTTIAWKSGPLIASR